jgi:hypothetical protein
MQAKITLFEESVEKFLGSEVAQNLSEQSDLVKLGKELPDFLSLFNNISSPAFLVLAILQTSEDPQKRKPALNNAFSEILQFVPPPGLLAAVRLLSSDELVKSLLPFIYDQGTKGSVACYLAARTAIKLAPEAFPHFLKARSWNQTDLFNLAFLARVDEIPSICSLLESSDSEAGKCREIYDEFRFILFNQQTQEPLLPDSIPVKPPASLISAAQIQTFMSASSKEESSGIASETANKTTGKSGKINETKTGSGKKIEHESSATSKPNPKAAVAAAAFVAIVAVVWFFSASEPESPSTGKKIIHSNRIPAFWTDAVSQKQITPKFLTADKDYRMGELFLTREKYSEALSLFEDAISIDPDHSQAMLRAAFCRIRLGDQKKAEEMLQKVLKKYPAIRLANLYLARIAAEQNRFSDADYYYSREIKINNDLSTALEYANYLEKSGKTNRASALVDEIQKQHPEKTIVLTSQPSDSSDRESAP